jgi:hypothetical protein
MRLVGKAAIVAVIVVSGLFVPRPTAAYSVLARSEHRCAVGQHDRADADETYDELLGKLADHKFSGVSESLRLDLVAYYGDVDSAPVVTDAQRRHVAKIREQLALLDAAGEPE